jgi:hypothetical protein
MYTDNALFFPAESIPALRNARGAEWRALVERVMALPPTHEETLALMLTMIRIDGCMGCETDSYRAMRGCSACAVQTLRRFKGDDRDLLDLYARALADVQHFQRVDARARQILPTSAPQMSLNTP